eukprot:1256714-Karenia_brevis.AAC.1
MHGVREKGTLSLSSTVERMPLPAMVPIAAGATTNICVANMPTMFWAVLFFVLATPKTVPLFTNVNSGK